MLAFLWNQRGLADPYCELQVIKQSQLGAHLFSDWEFLIGPVKSISLKEHVRSPHTSCAYLKLVDSFQNDAI
jgi:hypothetical protein